MIVLVVGLPSSHVSRALREAGHDVVNTTGVDTALLVLGTLGAGDVPSFACTLGDFRRMEQAGARVYFADDENPGAAVAVLEGATQWNKAGASARGA